MSAQFKKENIKGEEGEGRKEKPLHKMTPGGCDAILQEALLLGSYADFWKLATGYTKALCNVYVAPNPYPTPGGGDAADGHNPNSATQNMVKVTTTVPCSLRTFATFITAPRSVRYCEDNVMFCDIIERDNKTKLFHTAYAGDPPCDVVAVHITAAYKVPENTTENNPLCKFVASLRDDKRRGHVPQPLSTIFVYAMKSAEHPKTPPSPPYVRMRFHLSAFIAYEIPGPLVRVVFVHAPGDRTPKMVDRCITKMVCVRNLCQMLEWLNTGGPLTEPVIWENQRPQETPNAHSVGTENTREPNPLVEEPSDVVLQGDNPSSAPGRVFQTLFALHASAAWRLVLQHEGCTVEECEARCCFPAPAFLKAYRFATTIACSLDIFRRLVSDPMQLHRYDPSVEKVELLHSQKGEDTVHIHFKQLSHSAPKQDACILTSNALLQPDEAHRWRLYQLTDNINVVYVQNGIQSTEIPAAGACDRQVVYAMGYVAIPSVKRQPTGAGDGNEGSEALRVYHVVCVDNNTASLADKQLVTIRQHFFRLTGIRNLCEEAKSKPPTCSLPPHTTRDVNDFFESGTLAGFTEVETLEDASLERTSSTNNVRRQLDLVDGMEGYTSHATAHVDTMMNSSSLEKLHQFLLHFAPHYCIEHKQSELDNKLVPAAATLQPSPFTEQQQIYPSVWQAHAPTPDQQKQEVQTAQLVQRGKVSAPPAIQQSGGKAALTWDTSVEEVVPDKQKQEVQTAQLVQCGKVSAPPAIQQSEKGALDRKEKNVHMKNFMQAIHTEGEPIHRRRDDERLGLQPLQRKKGFQSIPTNLEEEASPVQVIGEESKRNSGEPQPVGGQGDCLARAVREGQEKLTRLTGGWCKGRIEKTSAFGEKDSPVQEVQVKENIPQVTCGLSVWPTPDALKVRREGMSVLKLSQRLELRPARQEPRRQEELIWPMKGGWQGSSGSASDGNEGLLLPMGSRSVDTDDVWEERVKLSDGTFGRKVNNKIQVNVRACRNMPAATQKKHMLSIQISTSSTEAQTGLVPLTLNPIFPHQTILLDEPEDDTVNVTAIVKTEDDRMKRLGEAVVSLRYLHVLDSYTRWISLICNVGTSDAFECGDVCITFRRGTEEGPNGVVSINGKQCEQQQLQWGEAERTQEEEKLRRYVRDVLVSAGNANLHLLEWLVGNCYRKTPGEIDAFIRRYRKDDTIMLTVFEVCGLRTEVGVPLLRPVPCHVLVETSRGSCTTSPVNLQGQAAPLNMVFHLVIGVNEPIRLIVFTGDTAVGETVITTAQDGTRTRVLVSRAGTEEAVPCGTITVGTRRGSVSELTESPKPLRVEVNEENSKRMAYLHHILWMNARSSLHKLDVIAASPLESGRLLEKFGPTAKWYDLRVSLRHWRPTSAAWDSPIVDNTLGTHKREKDGDELLQHVQTVYRRVFAVVHIGLQYHKTFEVRTDCAGEVHFNETFTFSGVCPRRDEVFVSVIGKGLTGTEDHDLGVTVLSMKSLKLQQRTHMTVPLVRQAGTRGARFQGSLYLELFAVNFDGVAANDYEAEMCRPSIRSILYHHAPKELHKAECFLGSYASREKDCLRELRKTYGPDILKLPMAIRLMSLNQLTPYPNSYLKVYLNDTPVIRTEKLSTDDPILFDPEDSKSRARVLVDDVYDVRLRFKVKQTRFLLTKTLCTGDFSLRGMVVSQEGVYWIPLVDNEGVSVGNLCVELKSSAFVYNDTVKRAKDFVEDDVVSLIRRYRPSKVPIMHMIMEKVSNREAAHSEIRREVVTEPVAATVFISVELLSIHRVFFEQTEEDDQQVWPEGETEYVVTAKYGGDESSTTTKNFTPQGNSSTIRLDVRTFRERKAHKLTITVRRQRTLPPPCPVKSSEAQNGKIPRFGPFCKATPVVSKQRPRVIMPQPPSLLHEPEYVGCAVISLRALFTPLLYSTGELVTVPLLYLPPNANGGPAVPDGRDHTGSGVHSEGEVVGNIAFRVRLPAYEQIPSWLQFDATTLEKEIKLDRAAIRYYEERIRNILAEHKSHCLWNMHYRLYEKYVASGHWHRLLRGWRNALLRQFPSANNSNDVPTSSMWYAPSTASDRNLRSDNMNSILERLKGEFSSDDSLMGDVAETEMTGGENSIETGSESESESD